MSNRPPLRLTLFGTPALYASTGNRVTTGMRVTALLAVLAIEPAASGRAWLAQLLWPDRQPEQARASLRQCLVELRHALERHNQDWPLTADTRQIAFLPDVVATDLADVLAACAASDRAALTEALRAATPRPLLADLQPSQAYAEWAATVRASLYASLDEALTRMLARRGASADDADWAASAELARARLAHAPSCPIAAAVLRGRRPASGQRAERQPLRPLPLPPDAPPAVYIATFGHGGSAAEGALATALREEIVSALSRFREVRVVTLDASEMPADRTEADTAYLLSVTLRSGTGEGAVIARLATAGHQVLWGSRFALVADQLGATIDGIVERIAAAVAPTVESHLAGSGPYRPSGTLHARYLAARAQSLRPPDHATARAVADELEEIVAQAPLFSSARLALARLYNTDFAWTRAMSSGDAERARALVLARSAVASDRGHVHGHSLLGWCHLRQHEWGAARRCFDEAVRLNPYHAERLMEVAYGLIHLGDLDAGEALLRRCMAINPVATDGFYFDLGMLALIRGDPLLAREQLAMMVEPDCWGSVATALAAVQAGAEDESAIVAARSAIRDIWPTEMRPTSPAVRNWVVTRHPFRLPQHLDRYIDGLDRLVG